MNSVNLGKGEIPYPRENNSVEMPNEYDFEFLSIEVSPKPLIILVQPAECDLQKVPKGAEKREQDEDEGREQEEKDNNAVVLTKEYALKKLTKVLGESPDKWIEWTEWFTRPNGPQN